MPSAPNAQCQEWLTMIQFKSGTAMITPKDEPCARIAVGSVR